MDAAQLCKEEKNENIADKERLLIPHMPIRFDAGSSAGKLEVNNYIKKRFAEMYNANIEMFSPYIVSTCNGEGGITATVGFQPALTKKRLFLETYLSSTIEEATSKAMHEAVERRDIIEVGNLSSSHKRGASHILFILSVAILNEAGYKWITFTATKHVQRLLKKLKLTTAVVCEADPSKLADNGASWGSYYGEEPVVLVGKLSGGLEQLQKHEVISSIIDNYQDIISEIAQKIKV